MKNQQGSCVAKLRDFVGLLVLVVAVLLGNSVSVQSEENQRSFVETTLYPTVLSGYVDVRASWNLGPGPSPAVPLIYRDLASMYRGNVQPGNAALDLMFRRHYPSFLPDSQTNRPPRPPLLPGSSSIYVTTGPLVVFTEPGAGSSYSGASAVYQGGSSSQIGFSANPPRDPATVYPALAVMHEFLAPPVRSSVVSNSTSRNLGGRLTLSAGSSIDLSSGVSVIEFAGTSSSASNPFSHIQNWSGVTLQAGGTEQLIFNSGSQLSLLDMSQIRFPGTGIVLTEANRLNELGLTQSGLSSPQLPTALVPVPLADAFDAAVPVGSNAFAATGSTTATTREPSEPRHNLHTNGASLWLTWQAPANGRFTLNISGQTNPVVMAVYTGASVDALTLATNNISGLPEQTQVWLRTNAVPYWLLTNSPGSLAGSLMSSNAMLEFLNTNIAATYLATQLVFNATAGQTYRIAFDAPVIRPGFTNETVLPTTGFTLNGDLSTFALQSPAPDQIFLSGQAIPLAVAPFNPAVDGTITQIDYFSGTNWIGSATAPFDFAWTNAPAVFHTLRAVATNELGEVRVTPPVTIRVLPSNDLFATAATFPNAGFQILADLGGATREAGEPTHAGNSQGKSLWWKWTPTADGDLNLSTTGSVGAVSLSVYTGSQLDQLSLVASNIHLRCSQFCGCGWFARSTGFGFGGLAGQTYYIAVDQHTDAFSYLTSSGGTGLISGGGITLGGGTLILGQGPNEGGSGTNYVNAYPPQSQPLVMQAFGAGGTVIVLRTSFTPRPPPSDPNSFSAQLTGSFTPGTVQNDRFANAIWLTLASNSIVGNNFTASKEPNEPWHGGKKGGRSVWYSWTASKSGHVWLATEVPPAYLQPKWTGVIEVVTGGGGGGGGNTTGGVISINNPSGCGFSYDATPPFTPVFGVYTGNSVSALTTIAGGNNLLFPVTAGTTYRIAVDENLGQAGNFNFYLVQFPTPANDLFANRITMIGTTIGAEGNNVGATTDAAGPANSVWWQWTALSFGQVNLSLANSDAQFPVTVYKGTNLNALTPVAAGIGGASFLGKIGTTYQIAIGSRDGFVGNYRMALTAPPVVISPASVVAGGSIKYLLGFPGTNGQFAIIQRQALPGGAWTNVVFSFVTNGMANHSSLPTTFPSWENYRALLFEGPMTLPRAQAALSGLQTNGNYRLSLDGIAGLKFRVKTSTNLIDWLPLATNIFSGDAFNFLHAAPSNAPAFYYMAEPLLQ